jgi:two-component system chemotaxis sensor kinase CheA
VTAPNPAVATFVEEARELIEGLEAQLLDLEHGASPEAVDSVFRVLHTLKGSGAMFGFTELARFTHHFEEAFDRVREGRVGVDLRLITLSLQARDHMRAMLDLGGDGPAAAALAATPEAAGLIADLAAMLGNPAAPAATAACGPVVPGPADADERVWTITFRPAPNALRNGMRPDLLMAELAGLGRVLSEVVDTSAVPDLAEIDPMTSYLGWTVRLATAEPRAAIEAVFIFADDADLTIAADGSAPATTGVQNPPSPSAGQPAPVGQVDMVIESAPSRAPAGERSAERAGRGTDMVGETIRVPALRLDEIVDQLGELVIAQARLSGLAARLGEPDLDTLSEEMGRLVSSLRDATLAIRMLPIETVFGKFRRVVRDLSAELGKDVVLVTEGGATEIDKNVIDRLSEPLVHMIRNSVDHGIEPVDRRRAAGKSDRGTVRLAASQEGGEVLIRVSDDGGGLNLPAIRARAVARGLIAEDSAVSDHELQQLIFAPGFSTAQTVSKVSGRGVGMDAVKTAIEALRGTVDVDSTPGEGCRITLRLPVSLAIIDGLLVRLGLETFVIPLSAVEECVELADTERRRESGRTMLQIREQLVPWLDLDAVFGRPPSSAAARRLVVVRCDGMRLGLVVDDIVGQHQTVIKTFSAYHRGIEGLSGATILGDGSVALIVDVASLARAALAAVRTHSPVAA